MASYSVVKIELTAPPGTEYKVYWDSTKHNHGASTAAGTAAVKFLAEKLHKKVEDFRYVASSFQSNQSSPPTGKNIYELTS